MFKLFSKKEENTNDFAAVVSGKIIPLTAVNDDVFSKGMMGTGVAIVPDDDVIVAPCDGEVTMLFPTMHAFGMKNEDGVEILVHIGIDTVNKQGVGFKKFVDAGTTVHRGDKIIRMNSYDLKQEGYDLTTEGSGADGLVLTTMMIFPGCEKKMSFTTDGYAKKGKTIVAEYKKEGE